MQTNIKENRISKSFLKLTDVIARLRAKGGCPWDREQTHSSLKPFLVEESYELIDAIDLNDSALMKEELGDVLLQVMLHAQIAAESQVFDVADVIDALTQKLIGRHPHVFGETIVADANDVVTNWEKIKKSEKKERGLFDGVPGHLPGLLKAARIGEKASRVGFDWETVDGVREKVSEELEELDEALASGDQSAVEHEFGDLFFAIAQLARHSGCAPEEAVRHACTRFRNRFEQVEEILAIEGRAMESCTIAELERVWQEAKKRLEE